MFLLSRIVYSEAYVKAFQYKVLNFILYANTKFDSVDPSSMQDTYHIWTQLNNLALHEFS